MTSSRERIAIVFMTISAVMTLILGIAVATLLVVGGFVAIAQLEKRIMIAVGAAKPHTI